MSISSFLNYRRIYNSEEAEKLCVPNVRCFLKGIVGNYPAGQKRPIHGLGFMRMFSTSAWPERVGLAWRWPKTQYGGGLMPGPFCPVFTWFIEELFGSGCTEYRRHGFADRQSAPLITSFLVHQHRKRNTCRLSCRGESYFLHWGMSGTSNSATLDLASIKKPRSACRTAGWLLNGQKVWTTMPQGHSHYMICVVRQPAVRRERAHGGMSQFIIDLTLPGITVASIADLAGARALQLRSFFDNVRRLDADALIEKRVRGGIQVTAELAFEPVRARTASS